MGYQQAVVSCYKGPREAIQKHVYDILQPTERLNVLVTTGLPHGNRINQKCFLNCVQTMGFI